MSLRDRLIVYFWGKKVPNECGRLADAILESTAIKELLGSLEELVEAVEPLERAMEPPAIGLYDLHLQVFHNIVSTAKKGKVALEGKQITSSDLSILKDGKYPNPKISLPRTTIEEDMVSFLIGD